MVEEAIEWGWDGESELKPEAQHWHQWNGHSPELEFCEYAAAFVCLTKPRFVVETGVGQGYLTRRTVPEMPPDSTYVCFETSQEFVDRMSTNEFFDRDGLELRVGMLTPDAAAQADLTIIDSAGGPGRIDEIKMWWGASKPGAFALIHDVSLTHPHVTSHYRHAEFVKAMKIPGVFISNPRGSFLGQKPYV